MRQEVKGELKFWICLSDTMIEMIEPSNSLKAPFLGDVSRTIAMKIKKVMIDASIYTCSRIHT